MACLLRPPSDILVSHVDADSTKRLQREHTKRLASLGVHPVQLNAHMPGNEHL